jgi:Skp family chaperone for outer membrane proteins
VVGFLQRPTRVCTIFRREDCSGSPISPADRKGSRIDVRTKALHTQEQALAQSEPLLTPEAKTQRTRDIEKFQIDLRRFRQDSQNQLMGVQRELESAFLAKLGPSLELVAKQRRLRLVINEDVGLIAWADPTLDITPDVVKRLEARTSTP